MTKAQYGNCDSCLWEYKPNAGAAMFFFIIWTVSTVAHIYQMFYYRKWYVWALIMGGIWELGGSILRFLSTLHPMSIGYYTPMLVLEILAPLWIAAFDYMTIGRLVHFLIPQKKIFFVTARYVTLIFVLSDVACFLVQMVGISMISGTNVPAHQMKLGTDILLGGLSLQVGFFCFFLLIAVKFEMEYKRQVGIMDPKTRWFLRALYISGVGVLVRSIYRVGEFAPPFPGPLWTHEAPFYVLDQLPLLPALIVFNIWHPGTVLVGEESSLRTAEKARKAEKKADKKEKKRQRQEYKQMKKNGGNPNIPLQPVSQPEGMVGTPNPYGRYERHQDLDQEERGV